MTRFTAASALVFVFVVVLLEPAAFATPRPATKLPPQPKGFSVKGDQKKGSELFAQTCALCHGAKGDGKGMAAAALTPPPPDFNDKADMKARSNWRLFSVIKDGGEKVGLSANMASYSGTLSDDQIKDLVAYIRTFSK